MRVLCLDPSGSFNEGNGTTGWAVFVDGKLEDFGDVKAEDFNNDLAYWSAVTEIICSDTEIVVCESFRLFAHKAQQQSWSAMETPQMIGCIRLECFRWDVGFHFQDPSIKPRVADRVLVHEGVFELKGNKHYCMGRPTNLHVRDAIRHGIFWHRYGKK